MSAMEVTTGVILFGHGSRDPEWHAPLEAIARRVAENAPGTPVACAFLELTTPDLSTAAQTLVDAGVKHIRILPMFLGVGRHAREDLPRLVVEVRERFSSVSFDLRPAIGTEPAVIELLARLAVGGTPP